MTTYENDLSMAAARQRYFTANGFDGSYDERWVRLKAGPIPIVFPNAPGRVRAVKLRDLHHIATGYQTTWTGEGEIGAWEIAGGCAHFAWAWVLNFSAMIIGMVIAPRVIFQAFVRGRHTRNLYGSEGQFNEAILSRLRRETSVMPTSTRVRGRYAIRPCFINPRMAFEDVDLMVDAIIRFGRDLDA